MADIGVEVCYAKPGSVFLKALRLPSDSTIRAAIEASGVLQAAPEIDLAQCRVGIYGKLKSIDTELREHDRVEIYRTLVADPKEARRRRAERKS